MHLFDGLPLAAVVLSILAAGIAGAAIAHAIAHRSFHSHRFDMARRFAVLADDFERLAREMENDDRLRAGINIGMDHAVHELTRFLDELQEASNAVRSRTSR